MILTLTPNPSLDRTYAGAAFGRGEVNRAESSHVDAGGKGINVSRALAATGDGTIAIFPSGGPDGAHLVDLLRVRGVPAVAVPVRGATRSNVTLAEADGTTTKINAPGPRLAPGEVDDLLDAVAARLDGTHGAVVVGAGSLPDGAGDDFYVRLGRVVAAGGGEFVLDTSGAPLAAAMAAGVADLVKPNDDELAEWAGVTLSTVGDVTGAAGRMLAAGARQVLVSLGAHGALLVTPAGSWWAGAEALVPVSTVGAGDVTLAGFLAPAAPSTTALAPAVSSTVAGDPADAALRGPEHLRRAVARGRAAVLLPGSAVPDARQIHPEAVRVVADPDPTLALKEL